MEDKKTKNMIRLPEKMFDVDPVTGKLIPLPLWPKEKTEAPKEDAKKPNPYETKYPLKPLDFANLFPDDPPSTSSRTKRRRPDSFNFKDSAPDSDRVSSKMRKLDSAQHSARRLFPVKKYENSRLTSKRESVRTIVKSKTRKSTISSTKSSSSPLLNMEEVEQNILKSANILGSYQFKPPKLSQFKFTLTDSQHKSKKLEVPQVIVEESEEKEIEPKTPDSVEFYKLEQLCKDSPVTSMCNLMQDTSINSEKTTKINSDAKEIKQFIIEEKIRHEKIVKEEETRHQQSMYMLTKILATIEKPTDKNDKENDSAIHRRSERLLKKSPLARSKLLTSPAILKCDDLRKNTLKKNLATKSGDYQICSPRTRKAMEMYQSLKSHSNIFETPKSDRKNLSTRLQDQCRLLQDTPVHK